MKHILWLIMFNVSPSDIGTNVHLVEGMPHYLGEYSDRRACERAADAYRNIVSSWAERITEENKSAVDGHPIAPDERSSLHCQPVD